MTIPPDPGFFTGCLWPVDPACLSEEWEQYDDALKLQSLALASSSLEQLVAGRVTACPMTIRPCRALCGCDRPACGACRAGCEITLPYVGRLISVMVDGEDMDVDNFRVDDQTTIVYQGDGECPFLGPQDLSKPLSDAGTWSITYLPAEPVDSLGAAAAAALAVEFAKACQGEECSLPAGLRAMVRFGATYDVQPGMFPDGFTGVDAVDAYIRLYNPRADKGQVGVWSPDMQQFRVV